PEHLVAVHEAFERWFHIPVPRREDLPRHSADELICLTPPVAADRPVRPLHELVREIGARLVAAARERLARLSPADRRAALRRDWAGLLGDVEPKEEPKVLKTREPTRGLTPPARQALDTKVERLALEVEPGIMVPLVLLTPEKKAIGK